MYAVIDIETTGGNARFEKITEIAVLIHDGEKIVEEFSTLINPEKSIPPFISRLTGITDDMVADAPRFFEVARKLVELTEGKIIVAHNAQFDYGFIREEFRSLGFTFNRRTLCTVKLARKLIPGHRSYSLGNICEKLGIENGARHRAAGDAHATSKLFDLLIAKDEQGILQNNVYNDPSLLKLPPNLSRQDVDNLPEETGVYYFHDAAGSIIYIGKSKNIRKRALSHFAEKEHPKTLSMKTEIASITYEITGSELVALLLESDEIKKHKPRYNRRQRESYFQWGIFKSVNSEGYITLKAARIKASQDEPLITAKNADEAAAMLEAQVEKYNLCQKLCGMYDIRYACFRYHVRQCKGACIGKEDPSEYNMRVIQLIRKWQYENHNFFILGEGRSRTEQSVVAVENGRYIGFGFIDAELAPSNPDHIRSFVKNYADNRDIQRIIQRHIQQPGTNRIISY